jgi:hypothetical protein
MIDTGVRTLDSLFGDICVLVTAAFALTLVPGLRLQDRSLLSMRDRGTALLVFLVLGLVEEAFHTAVGSTSGSCRCVRLVCWRALGSGWP